jgi:hypothetical protein
MYTRTHTHTHFHATPPKPTHTHTHTHTHAWAHTHTHTHLFFRASVRERSVGNAPNPKSSYSLRPLRGTSVLLNGGLVLLNTSKIAEVMINAHVKRQSCDELVHFISYRHCRPVGNGVYAAAGAGLESCRADGILSLLPYVRTSGGVYPLLPWSP